MLAHTAASSQGPTLSATPTLIQIASARSKTTYLITSLVAISIGLHITVFHMGFELGNFACITTITIATTVGHTIIVFSRRGLAPGVGLDSAFQIPGSPTVIWHGRFYFQ